MLGVPRDKGFWTAAARIPTPPSPLLLVVASAAPAATASAHMVESTRDKTNPAAVLRATTGPPFS